MNIIAVLVCGAVGGVLRFSLEAFGVFGTLFVNLMGSFALGLFYGLLTKKNVPSWFQNGMGVGLIGSFTTFSSFTSDTERLVTTSFWLAALYVVFSIGCGVVLALAGERLANLLLQVQTNDNQQESREQRRTFAQLIRYKTHTKTGGN